MRLRRNALGYAGAIVGAALALTALPGSAPAKGVEPRFDFGGPSGAPFPSDRFTVLDPSQRTGRRVDLPKPDCNGRRSDCDDIDVLNTLDGFNLQPRLSIPFTGPIDLTSVTSKTVFLFELGPTSRLLGVNQLVWDPDTNTVHVESDEFLNQHTRYLLVVTDGVRDITGDPLESAQFRKFLNFGQTTDPAAKAYRASLLAALDQLEAAGVPPGRVAAASLFTTQSATAAMELIRDQLSATTPEPAEFLLGSSGERTVFPLSTVTGISLRRQTSTTPSFQTSPVPLNLLATVPGAVDTIAFGRYRSPDYETAAGVIPPFGTLAGTPAAQGKKYVYFNLLLPSGSKPADGWPVVIFGHGFNVNKNNSLRVAAKLAQHGLATLSINAVGHGGGPLSTLAVNKVDTSVVTLNAGGRGIDQDGNGAIGTNEGSFATQPHALLLIRDALRQTVVDLLQLVRVIEVGIDVDGDGEGDLDPSRTSYIGGSFGGLYGAQFLALESAMQTGVVNTLGGATVDAARLGTLRPMVATYLGSRSPSLLNGGPLLFRENMPLRNEPAVVNDVPGAIAVQQQLERVEWAMQSGDPVAYAAHLRNQPLDGLDAKAVLIQFAKGDKSIPNPNSAAFIRAGDLRDRASYFRHDLAFAANPSLFPTNPHEFWNDVFTNPAVTAVALQAEEQAATFLAADGQVTTDPDGTGAVFEMPITAEEFVNADETLNFIP